MIRQLLGSRRVCLGCGLVVDGSGLWPRCPQAGDGGEHVLVRELDEARVLFGVRGDPHHPDRPFLRWRHRLHAWHMAHGLGWSDAAFVELVSRLERQIAEVDGHPFVVTPLVHARELEARLGMSGRLYIKDETHNVAGSHKARHLMGILLVMEVLGTGHDRLLAIASCGNAALAAGVLAQASRRCIRVFVPPDASPRIVSRLKELRAAGVTCTRAPGERGDPCVTRFRAAVRDGALPFTVQGPDNGLAIEGGETLGWEIVNQLDGATLDRIFVQVGGGALGSALGRALQQALRTGVMTRLPRIHPVQTRAVAPFARAYERLARRLDQALGGVALPPDPLDQSAGAVAFRAARAERLARVFKQELVQGAVRSVVRVRGEIMWPWESPGTSAAHGILDDETYDWLALAAATLESGGFPVVVDEATVRHANTLGVEATGIDADATGTAGLAGLLALRAADGLSPEESVSVLFTGVRRA